MITKIFSVLILINLMFLVNHGVFGGDLDDFMSSNFGDLQEQLENAFQNPYVHQETDKKVYYQGEVCQSVLNCPQEAVECWKEVNCGGDNKLVQASVKVTCLDQDKNELPTPPLDEVTMMDLMKECHDPKGFQPFAEFGQLGELGKFAETLGNIAELGDENLLQTLEVLKSKFKDMTAGLLDGLENTIDNSLKDAEPAAVEKAGDQINQLKEQAKELKHKILNELDEKFESIAKGGKNDEL